MIDKIAVLIACYNEASTIGKVVEDFADALPGADIYVYDNNSTDGTDEIARRSGAIVRYEYNQGKGNVVRRMFREIEADCYLMVDGDDTYPAEYAAKMCRLVLDKKADMVIGDRLSTTYFAENSRRFHGLGNNLVRLLVNKLFKSNIVDIMTGYRAFGRDFVKTFPVLSKGFEIETEMTIHALDKNFLIRNEPINFRDRPEGSFSKLNTFSDGFKVLLTIFNLFKDYKPLAFFAIFSALLTLIATILLIPVAVDYIHTGTVPRFPSLIVACFALLAAIQSFFAGLVLDTTKKKHQQLFELQLTMLSQKAEKTDKLRC